MLMINLMISILSCVERHTPLKKLTLKEIKLENKPWITSELNETIKISSFNRKTPTQ